MSHEIACPICEQVFKQPQGLHGHLRFSEGLEGDELTEVYEQAKANRGQLNLSSEAHEGQEAEADEPGDLPSTPTPEGQAKKDEQFDWKRRLRGLQSLWPKVEEVDQSSLIPGWPNRDEGAQEAISALEKIEMQVREQIGAPGQDPELRQSVDKSLNLIEGLTDCRTQREAIQERFSGEEADKRVQRLNDREVEIRLYIRDQWDVGKPVDELPEEDPLLDSGDSDGGIFGVGRGLITKTFES